MRRGYRGGLGVLTAVVLLGLVSAGGPAQSQGMGPIRIGFIAPQTGVFAANGRDMLNGFLMFWEERNNTAGGRVGRVGPLKRTHGPPNIPVACAELPATRPPESR